jgi:serine/threonine protein kinase
MDDAAVIATFLGRYLADGEVGRVRSLSEYQALFPGYEDLIAVEFAAAERGDPSQGAGSPEWGDSDERGLDPPPNIGRYPIIRVLTSGGMGKLFLARQPATGKTVVLKTVKAGRSDERAEALLRLRGEAKMLGKIDHEAICPVFDVHEEEDRIYVVMPFIDGESLAERIARAAKLFERTGDAKAGWAAIVAASDPPSSASTSTSVPSTQAPIRAVLAMVEKVARALDAAHSQNIVHRDVKPRNVMIRPDGKPVVLDFGLGVDLSSPQSARVSIEGAVLGTPAYMAPEQVRGEISKLDRRADVYALGVVLYELLTFRRPFAQETREALYAAILTGVPVAPRRRNPLIPRDLEAVCLRAMERDPAKRYPTAAELADEIVRVRNLEPTIVRPLSVIGHAARFLRRHAWSTAAAALVVALGTACVWFWLAKQAVQAPIRAFSRYSKALEEGRAPDEADLRILGGVYPDRGDAESFMRNPSDKEEYARMWRAVLASTAERGSRSGSEERLLEPRGTIDETRPTFRFQVPDAGAETWTFVLTLWVDDSPHAHTETIEHSGGARDLALTLPATVILELGKTYVWSVRRTGEPDPDHPRYDPDPARFRIEDPASRAAFLFGIKTTGDPGFDALVRAGALLRRGYAKDALTELDAMPPETPREARRLAMLFRAEAALRLGDRATFERLRKEAIDSGEPR